MARGAFHLLPLVLVAGSALAQDSEEDRDRGFLTGLIEDNLSAPGLSVRIDGFDGALSSEASLDVLQISDDEGVWLRLEDVVLDWNRSALLRGRLEVEELSAGLIRVERAPLPAEGVEALPDAGASGFTLPDLPVSVDIESLQADRIELGAPLLGQDVALTLDASAQLADGSGQARIEAQRLDGATGTFSIAVAFDGETEELSVDLDITEEEGGLAATLLQLPGAPAIRLTVEGAGPLDDFAADIAIASDGTERLGGQVTLIGTEDGRAFAVDLGGDVTSLFAPRYQAFFGDDVGLVARGLQRDDGRLDLTALRIDTEALTLEGEARLGPDGWPVFLDIDGSLESADGTPVLLPTADNSQLRRARLSVTHDADVSDNWSLELAVQDYSTPTLTLGDAALTARGILSRSDGSVDRATAAIEAALNQLDFTDPALAQAVGPRVGLTADVDWRSGAPVRLSDLALTGPDYRLTGQVTADNTDAERPLTLGLDLQAAFGDLSRLAALAGQDLSGSAETSLQGEFAPVAGSFDLSLGATTQDLALGIPQADALLAGETTLAIAARRTVDGTFVDALRLASDHLTATGSVALLDEESAPRLQGRTSRASFEARVEDGTRIDPRLDGPIEVAADLNQGENGTWTGTLDAVAPQGVTVSASGTLTGPAPDLTFSAAIPDISAFAEGVPGGLNLSGRAFARDDIWSVEADAAGPWDLTARVSGPVTGPEPRIAFDARLPDLSGPVPAFADQPALAGPVSLAGTLTQANGQWSVDTTADGPSGVALRARGPVTGEDMRLAFTGTVPELGNFVPAIEGRLDLEGSIARMGEDYAAEVTARGPYDAVVTAETVLTRTPLRVGFTADIPSLAPIAPVPDGLSVSGEAIRTDDGFRVDLAGTGPYAATIDATLNLADGIPSVDASGQIPDASALAPQLRGPLNYDVSARQEDGQFRVEVEVDGARGLSATVSGIATGPDADLAFQVNAANVAPFVPGLSGPLNAAGRLFRQDGQWAVDLDASGPLGATLDAEGVLTGASPNARFTLAVPDVGPLLPDISGPLRVEGTARQEGDAYAVDVDLDGPAGTNAAVTGRVGTDATLDLSVTGSAPLGLANAALAPRRLAGVAQFDLSVNGPPALDALSGTITTEGAALSLPSLRNGLDDIDARVTLSNGRADVSLTASPQSGGRLAVDGPVDLSSPFDANLVAEFDITLEDPSLYTAEVEGRVSIDGPLTGGALIAGDILIDGAEIAVPSSGLTAVGDLPEITHLNTPRPVQRTLVRAGQDDDGGAGNGGDPDAGGPVYRLDLDIRAPGRIFVRGRGLDAELGGALALRGTTADPVTTGGFELLRGRLDILQQRFVLDEGSITFQGDLTPFIRLVAETETDTITAAIVIEGPADAIEVSFESTPDVPQEEIVAQIFFGRDLSQLSPLQALQLANSIAVLSGRGSGGLLDRLRGDAGLDDLDVTTDDEGNVALNAGKYLSDNVYTDVQIDQNGDADISLNLDVTPNLTVRGSVGAAGNTSLGLFYEKDY
ncbi:translocation/assembly module TamB domain-containing protein [Jannaschia sp. S6380]|uniref:translocation/assembly module TamB domain-containing protein n=1 Tax=Jannaschia sp. S6380 TaxID=2926408 RepID=UPI001FF27173|nr:translocation/assembly module TamB domain-containing protein [Jannaschia sp. S6380]MCK0169046.1 translocation/assembly module TamB domain-containing protein [Jannaschia sp. S6380]